MIVKNPRQGKAGTLNIGKIAEDLGILKKEKNPLIEEAKKYKSADDFIYSEPELEVSIDKIVPTE